MAVVLVVPPRVQLMLFYPVTHVYVGETYCLGDLLTGGGFTCSWGPSH